MAKGQHLSAYQQKIVRRHYEHFDTKVVQRLQETLSELFLADRALKQAPADPAAIKHADKLWKKVEENLAKAKAPPADIARTAGARRLDLVSELITRLTAPR